MVWIFFPYALYDFYWNHNCYTSYQLHSVYSSPSLLQLCNSSFFNSTLWCNSPFFPSIRYTQESVQTNLMPTTQFLTSLLLLPKLFTFSYFELAYKMHRSNEVLPKPIHCPDSSNPSDSYQHSAPILFVGSLLTVYYR